MTVAEAQQGTPAADAGTVKKLHGRAFYESIGSPKFVVAPMVDQSEFVSRSSTLFDAELIAHTTGV